MVRLLLIFRRTSSTLGEAFCTLMARIPPPRAEQARACMCRPRSAGMQGPVTPQLSRGASVRGEKKGPSPLQSSSRQNRVLLLPGCAPGLHMQLQFVPCCGGSAPID